jgi:hypothetical protein
MAKAVTVVLLHSWIAFQANRVRSTPRSTTCCWGMNYAEDRLDRRARHDAEGKNLLWKDYTEALQQGVGKGSNSINHELLANTLRDIGWNSHALYHYGQAWCEASAASSAVDLAASRDGDDDVRSNGSWKAAGDYAQMAELAGFPEVGVLALLVYRARGDIHSPASSTSSSDGINQLDPSWLQQKEPSGRNCGCGLPECGSSGHFFPGKDTSHVLAEVATYCHEYSERRAMTPIANEILGQQLNDNILPDPDIPELLLFWRNNNETTTTTQQQKLPKLLPLPCVLQLLLIKLLYLTLPVLAAEAVAYTKFDEPARLAADYKSHWAYYVFIRALTMGERSKPHRRRTDLVNAWDILWGLDHRHSKHHVIAPADEESDATNYRSFFTRLRSNIETSERTIQDPLPPLLWQLPHANRIAEPKPIFFVGDSHVLSLAWQTLWIPDSTGGASLHPRLVVPVITTGLKAWHVRHSTRFFTHTCLKALLDRVSAPSIVVSAGEIDCREGLGGPLLEGYTQSCHEHVVQTVKEYINALHELVADPETAVQQILVMPIAPHKQTSKGRVEAQAARRETSRAWNKELRSLLPIEGSVFLLDYETALQVPDQAAYILKPAFNADSTHMNAAFAPHLEEAIANCGCDLDLF